MLSCGLSLLSIGTISNLTPAGLFLLKCSAMNCQLLIWFCPTGAISPDNGSTQPILTVSPFWANATPALAASSDAIDRFNRCLVMTTVSDCDECTANESCDGT